jgi:hypothetical protein
MIAEIYTNTKFILIAIGIIAISLYIYSYRMTFVKGQSELDSNNYTIVDPTVDSGGGVGESTTYGLLDSTGLAGADVRLESTTYRIGSGFPNGIQANVPKILCAETDTNSGTTDCLDFPNANGAQGECGGDGCYDRAKVEIDHEDNPIDSLFLIMISDTDQTITYYVQSDHTLSTTYDINDYMTLCEFHGKDSRDTACDDSGDGNWDNDLQSTNVYGLAADRNYDVSVRALNGDFTESGFGPTASFTTQLPSLSLDLDIGTTSAANTAAPHAVSLGNLSTSAATTAPNQIWLDLETNAVNGMSTYVKDANNALASGANTIPSEAEDLATDPNTNGGYGLKTDTSTETALGPIVDSSNFATAGAHEVGNLTTSNKLIFSTNTTGGNVGPLDGGRCGIYVKARATNTTPTGNYSDVVTFTMVGSF